MIASQRKMKTSFFAFLLLSTLLLGSVNTFTTKTIIFPLNSSLSPTAIKGRTLSAPDSAGSSHLGNASHLSATPYASSTFDSVPVPSTRQLEGFGAKEGFGSSSFPKDERRVYRQQTPLLKNSLNPRELQQNKYNSVVSLSGSQISLANSPTFKLELSKNEMVKAGPPGGSYKYLVLNRK